MKLILANEAQATRRRVYFDLRDATDGITPETGEAGGQPQISVDGAAWTNAGIGTLVHIGSGRYHAEITQATLVNGAHIETRFKSANTLETPGDSVQVVAFNPNDADGLGLSRMDAAIGTRLATAGYTAPANSDIVAIKAKTDNLPADPASNTQVNTRLATAGYTAPPTAAQVATAVWDYVIEGTRKASQVMRLLRSALMTKATGLGTRSAAETLTFRDEADTKTRATVTLSTTGERSVVIGDLD